MYDNVYLNDLRRQQKFRQCDFKPQASTLSLGTEDVDVSELLQSCKSTCSEILWRLY